MNQSINGAELAFMLCKKKRDIVKERYSLKRKSFALSALSHFHETESCAISLSS
jgi:hypothetical protein